MDDPRFEAGMPILDRQPVRGQAGAPASPPASLATAAAPARAPAPSGIPASLVGLPARSVPEARPTPLQKHYVLLSAPALVLGTVAITALEVGVAPGSPLIKLCVIVGAPLLAIANADAIVRIWRSAWAWMPVDAAKGRFRLAWVAVGVILYALLLAAAWTVLTA
jgi:hypothetical protein